MSTAPVIVPFWFKQRQCKAEPRGDDTLEVSGPNLGTAYLQIRPGQGGRWSAALRLAPEGPDVAVTEPEFPSTASAWDAAFELFRTHIIT